MVVVLMIAAAGAAQSGLTSQASPPPIAVASTPPPPIIAVPTAPMPPMIRVSEPFPKISNVTVRIRALAGRTVLLDGRFRVGRSSANFSQNRSEAAEQSCPLDYGGQSVRTSFSMSLRPQGMDGKYHLSTSWQRPSGSCDEQGTRSVSLEQSVSLKAGQTAVVEGDGGLRVEITQL